MCSEFKEEIEFSKCGEIFITKKGIFRYVCVVCALPFQSNYLFIKHVLQNHLSEHREINNEIKELSENDNFTNYPSLSVINCQKIENNYHLKDDFFLKKYNIRKKLKILLERNKLSDNVFRKREGSTQKKLYTIFKCSICTTVFNNNIKLKQHYKKNHLPISINDHKLVDIKSNNNINTTLSKCKYCLKTFYDENSLKKHYIIHKKKFSLKCDNPKVQVILKKYLKNSDGKISVLKGSKKSRVKLVSKDNLNLKIAVDKKETKIKNEIHVCEICGKESTTKYNLNSHIKLKHSSEDRKKYSCDHCKKTFVREQSLQNHIKIMHLKEKSFVCNIDKCERRFVDEKSLKNHQAFHINERKFICSKCGKKYLHKSKLDAHFKIYHVLGRIHQCKECSKSFYDPYTLRNHMICHTGEKPFVCDECPAKFPRENALQWHKKVHSGVKDHICKICGQAYHLFTGLYAHMKTHGIKYNKKIEKGLIPIENLVPENNISIKTEQLTNNLEKSIKQAEKPF